MSLVSLAAHSVGPGNDGVGQMDDTITWTYCITSATKMKRVKAYSKNIIGILTLQTCISTSEIHSILTFHPLPYKEDSDTPPSISNMTARF
jgi:hypothetical protein